MKKVALFILSLTVFGVLCGTPFTYAKVDTVKQKRVFKYHTIPYQNYKDRIDASYQTLLSEKKQLLGEYDILGGIAPHHVPTAFPLMVELYGRVKEVKDIKTVVVLGPDHFNAGMHDITTSEKAFLTPYGLLEPDTKILTALKDTGLIGVDEKPFPKEHSISSHAVIIKKIFPHAKIVPLIFRASVHEDQAVRLGKKLASILNNHTLVIASVDFSHYLPVEQARRVDRQSLIFVKKATPSLVRFIDVDSPTALTTLFTYLKKVKGDIVSEARDANMADYTPVKDNTTGYVLAYFGREQRIQNSVNTFRIQAEENVSKDSHLLFLGDSMVSRHIEEIMKKKNDWEYPFALVKKQIQASDFSFANLENPFRGTKKINKGNMVFGADPRSLQGFVSSGIDAVTLANNHIFDQGKEGVKRTIKVLHDASIGFVGAGNTYSDAHTPLIQDVQGTKIAILGYTPFLPSSVKKKNAEPAVSDMKEDEISEDIKKAKEKADIVVVTIHWGEEYHTKHNAAQEKIAHAAIESGATLVIGHHPHVPQEIEKYKDGYIAYSLGNFVFDQNFSKDTHHGLAVEAVIRNHQVVSLIPHEVRFTKSFQPYFVDKMNDQ